MFWAIGWRSSIPRMMRSIISKFSFVRILRISLWSTLERSGMLRNTLGKLWPRLLFPSKTVRFRRGRYSGKSILGSTHGMDWRVSSLLDQLIDYEGLFTQRALHCVTRWMGGRTLTSPALTRFPMVVIWKLDQVWNMGHDILSMENPASVCNVLNTKQHKSIATNLLYEGIINNSFSRWYIRGIGASCRLVTSL